MKDFPKMPEIDTPIMIGDTPLITIFILLNYQYAISYSNKVYFVWVLTLPIICYELVVLLFVLKWVAVATAFYSVIFRIFVSFGGCLE